MFLAVVVLFGCVLAVAGAALALSVARQALDRCDQMQREIAAATLDYRQKTAAARRKGWNTRRRKAAELEARQLVFGDYPGKEFVDGLAHFQQTVRDPAWLEHTGMQGDYGTVQERQVGDGESA
jgi:hypothetical protein